MEVLWDGEDQARTKWQLQSIRTRSLPSPHWSSGSLSVAVYPVPITTVVVEVTFIHLFYSSFHINIYL